MEKYAIYKYKLTETLIRNEITSEEEVNVTKLSPEKRFELLFSMERGGEVRVQKFKRNGTSDKPPCCVLSHDSNIILLRLINEIDKDIWEECSTDAPVSKIEKTKKKSKPYGYVIIDNRPNSQIIAIQSNSVAWRNPNDVKKWLQESFNSILDTKNYGVEVSIWSKMMPSNFWDYVNKKRKKDKVYIKSMTFSFTNHKRRPDIDIKQALSSEWRHFESFIGWMDQLGGDKGEIKILPPKNEALMKRKYSDIKHMVEICMNSNYALSITFSDDITYKCNQELRAEFPMQNEQIRIDFENRQGDLFNNYDLMNWLDDVIKKTEEYNDIEEVRRKSGGKTHKQVS